MSNAIAWAHIENIATLIAMVAIIVGGYAFGAGGWSWLGLLLLFNMNTINSRTTSCR